MATGEADSAQLCASDQQRSVSLRMNQLDRKLTEAKSGSLFLRSTSAVSLNERFSQVLVNQLTCSGMVTFDPIQLQQRKMCAASPVVLLMKSETLPSLPNLQTRDPSVRMKQCLRRRSSRRKSVWTRLGWQQAACRRSAARPKGFWSFRNKYRRRAGFTCTFRRRTQLSRHLQRGRATSSRGRGLSRNYIPTKKQLDAELDEYMSKSKSRLDKDLDEYMSMSRRCLDAQLDEYMSMAGQVDMHWD